MLKKYVIMAVVLAGSLFLAYQYGKSKAQVITQVQEVERVVEKRDIVTVTKEVARPDGTKEVITTVEDRSTINTKKEKEVVVQKSQWFIAAGASLDKVYTAEVNRRVLGDIFIGAYATTNNQIGVKVGIEF